MRSNNNLRKLPLTLFAVAAFFLLASLQMVTYSSSSITGERNLGAAGEVLKEEEEAPAAGVMTAEGGGNMNSERPIVKTFFHSIENPNTDDIDDPIIKIWREEWELAGFEPQVVTLEDAKRHPDYETMKEALQKVFPTDVYNQYCFFRYLAMAATGGGWHSDYDTIPANFPITEALPLPNDGQFTSYQTYVPALISASEEEWTRVAKLMVEHVESEGGGTDMRTLLAFYLMNDKSKHGIDFKGRGSNYVLNPEDVVKDKHSMNCELMNNALAVHYSHHGFDVLSTQGKYPIDVINFNIAWVRAKAIKAIMDIYREQCETSRADRE